MSITYTQNEGSRTTARTINNITGGVLSVNTGDLTTALVGDIVEIFGSSTTANNGFYTIVAINTGATPDQYTLRPAPVDQGASGSAARLNRSAARTLGASAVSSVVVLSGGLAIIRVAGANFLTNGVQPSDRVALSGSSISAHNGAWIIFDVLDEEQISVVAVDGGAGMTAEAVGTGSVAIRHGLYTILFSNEATLSFQRILDVGVPLGGPSGGSPYFAPSSPRVLVRRELVGGFNSDSFTTRTLYRIYGVGTVQIDQSGLGAPSVWNSQNEIAINARNSSPGSGGALLTMRFATLNAGSWGVGNDLEVIVGSQPGNRFSAADGSYWLGFFVAQAQVLTGRIRFNFFGSMVDYVNNQVIVGDGGDVSASLVRPTLQTRNGVFESVIAYGSGGIVGAAAGDQNNILVAQQTSGSSVGDAGVVLEGFLLSDTVNSPYLNNISGGLVTLLNPRDDYDLAVMALNLTAGSTVEKRYLFNPTFAQFVAPFAPPIPASGLTVTINEINETTQAVTTAFSGVTDSNGKLNSGVGIELRRQLLDNGNTSTLYSHHIEVLGPGYRHVSQIFQLRAPAENAITIPRIAPDYEGELSR